MQSSTPAAKKKFTPDMTYICNRMGIPAPFLPVDTDEEKKLFKRHVAAQSGSTDFEQMVVDWCDKTDGMKVFPKLPVYLRNYHQKVERIDRIKDAVRSAKKGQELLSALNQRSGGDITILVPSSSPLLSSSASSSTRLRSSATCKSKSRRTWRTCVLIKEKQAEARSMLKHAEANQGGHGERACTATLA